MPQLKNQVFINNITDPLTGNQVKKIFQTKISKIGRIVEPMVWEYYKNRANMSVEEAYKKFIGYKLKIIFFNDPIIHVLDNGHDEKLIKDAENAAKSKAIREESNDQDLIQNVNKML